MSRNLQTLLTGLTRDRRGSVAVSFSLTAVALLSTVGVSIDLARAVNSRTRLQSALDTAAIAAVRTSAASREEVTAAFVSQNIPRNYGTVKNVVVETLATGQVKVAAELLVPTTFTALFRTKSIEVAATSTVDPEKTVTEESAPVTTTIAGGTPCIHVLDESAYRAFESISGSNLNASSCELYVRSSNAQAMKWTSPSGVRFKRVQVVGGTSGRPNTIISAPNVVETAAPALADPYRAAIQRVVDATPVGACTAANSNKTLSGTVNPGTFCGTTTFSGARFNPGTYIIRSSATTNGGLRITGSAQGTGVSFYLADDQTKLVTYSAGEGSKLTAPTSGTTRGLLFFEAPRETGDPAYNFTMSSVNKNHWEGFVYLPRCNFRVDSLSEWPKLWIALTVNTFFNDSLSTVWTPFQWVPFDASNPISYPGLTVTSSTTTETEKPLYISE